MEQLTAGGAIIGIINGVQMKFPQVTGIYAFILALILGITGGYFQILGLTVETGVITALASSGVYKVASKVGSVK